VKREDLLKPVKPKDETDGAVVWFIPFVVSKKPGGFAWSYSVRHMVHNQRRWIPPCRARTGLRASAVARADRIRSETPASPFAGMTVYERLASNSSSPACDPPTQQSSHAGDDGSCGGDYKTPSVIPAKAGIQCRCMLPAISYLSRNL